MMNLDMKVTAEVIDSRTFYKFCEITSPDNVPNWDYQYEHLFKIKVTLLILCIHFKALLKLIIN